MNKNIYLLFCLPLSMLHGGCATSQCLQLPVSTKISDDAVARCHLEARGVPERRDVFERAIKLAWARGLYEEMVALSKSVLAHDAQRSDARYYLAVSLRKLGQCEAALETYRAYAEQRVEDADPYFGMALCHEARGQKRAAVAAYEKYLTMEKRADRQAWRDKARARVAALSTSGRLMMIGTRGKPGAKPTGRAARPKTVRPPLARPKTPSVMGAAKAIALVAKKPVPPDCTAHVKKFKADPFATAAYAAYAECALKRKEAAKVVKTMRMAIRDNPDFHQGWLLMGKGYAAQGQKKQAQRAFSRACKAGVGEACGLK